MNLKPNREKLTQMMF